MKAARAGRPTGSGTGGHGICPGGGTGGFGICPGGGTGGFGRYEQGNQQEDQELDLLL